VLAFALQATLAVSCRETGCIVAVGASMSNARQIEEDAALAARRERVRQEQEERDRAVAAEIQRKLDEEEVMPLQLIPRTCRAMSWFTSAAERRCERCLEAYCIRASLAYA